MGRREEGIESKILKIIKKYNMIESGDKIVLGVSGGPDSICMLDILYKLREKLEFKIVVCHINHGLRNNALGDEQFVENFCKNKNIEYYCLHANIIEESKRLRKGLEETGRIIRYKFFNEVMEKTNSNKIAIAHNKNDNSETIIMNLLRGSGIKGLKGIEPVNSIYIRPLINIDRQDIEKYCIDNNIQARHDETNDENDYTRNKIRNIIIPYIKKEFNPNIVDALSRLSEIAIEENEYINRRANEAYKRVLYKEKNIEKTVYYDENMPTIILDLKKFNEEDLIIRKNIILITIKKLFGDTKGIEKIHIDDIIKLCSNNIGNKYLTPNKKIKIVTKNKKIEIFRLN